MTFPEEDLFVVYRGVNQNGDFSLDVRVNPFIMFVWIGFGMLMVGTLFALVGKRNPKRQIGETPQTVGETPQFAVVEADK